MNKDKIIKEALIQKRNKLIESLYKEGFSFSDMAFIFNVAHTTIMRVIKK